MGTIRTEHVQIVCEYHEIRGQFKYNSFNSLTILIFARYKYIKVNIPPEYTMSDWNKTNLLF